MHKKTQNIQKNTKRSIFIFRESYQIINFFFGNTLVFILDFEDFEHDIGKLFIGDFSSEGIFKDLFDDSW
jgi:hypothetical protein